MSRSWPLFLMSATVLLSTVMCAQEKQSQSNDQKHTFRVETDSGSYGFAAEKLDPKKLGVAIYPGAQVAKDDKHDGENEGANLSLDWGQASLRLYAQKYFTTDSADKVLAFYRKQLSRYGAVLECQGGKSVVEVSSSLKCEDGNGKGIELKVGTKDKQHIVGVTPKDGGTEFGVVYLENAGHAEM